MMEYSCEIVSTEALFALPRLARPPVVSLF